MKKYSGCKILCLWQTVTVTPTSRKASGWTLNPHRDSLFAPHLNVLCWRLFAWRRVNPVHATNECLGAPLTCITGVTAVWRPLSPRSSSLITSDVARDSSEAEIYNHPLIILKVNIVWRKKLCMLLDLGFGQGIALQRGVLKPTYYLRFLLDFGTKALSGVLLYVYQFGWVTRTSTN